MVKLRPAFNQLTLLKGDDIAELVERDLIDVRYVRASLSLKKAQLLRAVGELQRIKPESDDEATTIGINIQWAESTIKIVECLLEYFPKLEPLKSEPRVRPSMAGIRRILEKKA